MKRFILKILVALVLIIIGLNIDESLHPEFVGGGFILLITVLVIDGFDFFYGNRRRLKLALHSFWIGLFGKYIRFSMSYQYLIKVDDKFLLVQNANPNWNWYQHVGGKYKRLPETYSILKKLGATDDLRMKTGGLKKGDLAVFVPARNALKFLDWFNSEKDREISHWREFYEELLGGKADKRVLKKKNFPFVKYRFIKSVQTPLKRAPIESGWNCWEILQYDVLELIPNEPQLMELKDLLSKGDTEYIKWASAKKINSLGYNGDDLNTEYNIGPHAKWVLNLKWSKE
ncbi:hypothetical protein J1N09_06115 [Aureitalea sp. L0-47]|uniref:SMODS-associated NUDIX domain-containing protein n=1 Tax=Aureitalea sp. L0-47 TaxID=2816962 RepID=UPI002236F412|nr:hypothetical protein [Aureitalea sp. L0-47]MCW5519404.1 hypothetical protein [Aureitalea sp. L0-47]